MFNLQRNRSNNHTQINNQQSCNCKVGEFVMNYMEYLQKLRLIFSFACFILFCFLFFSFLFLCFVLFCCVLFCFVLFCFVLFCFILFYFVLFYFVLFCWLVGCLGLLRVDCSHLVSPSGIVFPHPLRGV